MGKKTRREELKNCQSDRKRKQAEKRSDDEVDLARLGRNSPETKVLQKAVPVHVEDASTPAFKRSQVAMDLPKELLVDVFMYLGVKDLGSCARVNTSFHEVTLDQRVWRSAAHAIYSQNIAEKTIALYGGNWRDLLKDKNVKGALPVAYVNLPCRWHHNSILRHYCCMVVGFQWYRVTDEIRLYIDARGESDLRDPIISSVRWRDQHDSSMVSILGRWRPEVQVAGHYKGYLRFAAKQWREFDESGVLTFCYANRFHGMGDYQAVEIPFWNQLKFDNYTLNESLFASDTTDSEQSRWKAVVPKAVIERSRGDNGFTPVWWV